MIDRMSHACYRVGVISILTKGGDCAKMDALVVHDKPLGYDLLTGINAICEVGDFVIRPTGEVQFSRKCEFCAVIMIEEQDFCAVFDHKEKVWTGKWTGNKAPDQLHNTVAEYTVSDKSRAAYKKELETWITNSWLIPYPQE